MMIKEIRNYILECELFSNKTINIDYLGTKIDTFSINENAGYDPLIETSIVGDTLRQFQFNIDAKFHWNDENLNNINNSEFFESFRKWLNIKNAKGEYPTILGISPEAIETVTDGFIFSAESDEAIYRISCKFTYWEHLNSELVG